MQQTMAWRFDSRLLVVVHSTQSPSNLEWMRFLNAAQEHGYTSASRVLVISHGGGPDGEQRRLLTRAMGGNATPTVVMTKSPIVRAIVATLTFFNSKLNAVELSDNDKAFDLLGLTKAERSLVKQLRLEFEQELGITDPKASQRPSQRAR
jgi:hypothetical protein